MIKVWGPNLTETGWGPELEEHLIGPSLITNQNGHSVILLGGRTADQNLPQKNIYRLTCTIPGCTWEKLTVSLEHPLYHFVALTVPSHMLPNFTCDGK